MRPAPEYAELTGPGAAWSLYHWEAYDPASRVDLSASALGSDSKLFFVDPIPLAKLALAELTAGQTPAGIVVTNGNHLRAADEFCQRWQVPLAATAEAAHTAGQKPDETIPPDGGPVFGGIFEAVPLPGGAVGEVALYRADGGVLIVGDAVINLPSFPFGLLPDKYCTDAKALRRAVTRLLEYPFATMLFAHGEPLTIQAHARLAAMLKETSK